MAVLKCSCYSDGAVLKKEKTKNVYIMESLTLMNASKRSK